MKKTIYLIIIMVLVGIASVIIAMGLGSEMQIQVERAHVLYLVAKGISLLLIVGVAVYLLIKKGDYGNQTVLVLTTILFQLVPLLLRLVLKGDNPNYFWALVISSLSVVAYFTVFLLLDLSNDKIKQQ